MYVVIHNSYVMYVEELIMNYIQYYTCIYATGNMHVVSCLIPRVHNITLAYTYMIIYFLVEVIYISLSAEVTM